MAYQMEPTIDAYSREDREKLLEEVQFEFLTDYEPKAFRDSTPIEDAVMFLLDVVKSHEKMLQPQ